MLRSQGGSRHDVVYTSRYNIGTRVHAFLNPDGAGTFLCGTRDAADASIWQSTDYGKTWSLVSQLANTSGVSQTGVADIDWDGVNTYYALTMDSKVYKKVGVGAWGQVGQASSAPPPPGRGVISYGLKVTAAGTVLVSDTAEGGGRVFRSTNGGANFSNIGALNSDFLFRFYDVDGGIVVNTWGGKLYKTTTASDGAAWTQLATVSSVAIFAFLNCGGGRYYAGDDDGKLYESTNSGANWTQVGQVGGACDALVQLGNDKFLLCTWAGSLKIYFSDNRCRVWREVGLPPTAAANDFMERMLVGTQNGTPFAIGGINSGHVVRIEMGA